MATTAAPASLQKDAQIIHPTRTKTKLDPPLDFSFLNITSLTDVLHEEPRGQKDKKSDEKYDAKCIKLNNNHIEDAAELTTVMEQMILQPAAITWIDFSFNKLQKIDPVFCEFPSLQILYLHGNSIKDITEVDKLAKLQLLRKLALHGNAVVTTKHYRLYVISQCSQLINLDMSTVSKAERETAAVFTKRVATLPKTSKKPKKAKVAFATP